MASSSDCKDFLVKWAKENKDKLHLNTKEYIGPNATDGTKKGHWIRRGKGKRGPKEDGVTMRAFELYLSKWALPDEYAVLFELEGKIIGMEWQSTELLCKNGLRIDIPALVANSFGMKQNKRWMPHEKQS